MQEHLLILAAEKQGGGGGVLLLWSRIFRGLETLPPVSKVIRGIIILGSWF